MNILCVFSVTVSAGVSMRFTVRACGIVSTHIIVCVCEMTARNLVCVGM